MSGRSYPLIRSGTVEKTFTIGGKPAILVFTRFRPNYDYRKRYTGKRLRQLRAQRGVGSVRRISDAIRAGWYEGVPGLWDRVKSLCSRRT